MSEIEPIISSNAFIWIKDRCDACNASGEIEGEVCYNCEGRGYVDIEISLKQLARLLKEAADEI